MSNLSEIISPAFFNIHNDIKKGNHTYYWLKGGRGSTKSSFISIEIILGIMKDSNANCIALRKVGVNLKDSVYEQFLWAIRMLGVQDYFQAKLSPLEIIYKSTGQKIIFRGADKTEKIKSTKFNHGYCKFIWYEEVDEFNGIAEIRNINQSLVRGGDSFCVFYSFNPPKSQSSWVNREILNINDDTLVHHSTFLSVPRAWLGEQFFLDAYHLEKSNNKSYRHEYLGEVIGTGGAVFSNVEVRPIAQEEIAGFDRIARGLDWGYASDPLHYTVNHLDSTRNILYIFFEIHLRGLSNKKAYEMIKNENVYNSIIICDSAEPKSIAEFSSYGFKIVGAKKGPDSVEYGIKWLQDLEAIIIDPIRCPNTAKEFLQYELESDGHGGFKAYFPDKNNHSIDAIRYSRENDMKNVRVN